MAELGRGRRVKKPSTKRSSISVGYPEVQHDHAAPPKSKARRTVPPTKLVRPKKIRLAHSDPALAQPSNSLDGSAGPNVGDDVDYEPPTVSRSRRRVSGAAWCHQCHQKRGVSHQCVLCTKFYCAGCMSRRYDEVVDEQEASRNGGWKCPRCCNYCDCKTCIDLRASTGTSVRPLPPSAASLQSSSAQQDSTPRLPVGSKASGSQTASGVHRRKASFTIARYRNVTRPRRSTLPDPASMADFANGDVATLLARHVKIEGSSSEEAYPTTEQMWSTIDEIEIDAASRFEMDGHEEDDSFTYPYSSISTPSSSGMLPTTPHTLEPVGAVELALNFGLGLNADDGPMPTHSLLIDPQRVMKRSPNADVDHLPAEEGPSGDMDGEVDNSGAAIYTVSPQLLSSPHDAFQSPMLIHKTQQSPKSSSASPKLTAKAARQKYSPTSSSPLASLPPLGFESGTADGNHPSFSNGNIAEHAVVLSRSAEEQERGSDNPDSEAVEECSKVFAATAMERTEMNGAVSSVTLDGADPEGSSILEAVNVSSFLNVEMFEDEEVEEMSIESPT